MNYWIKRVCLLINNLYKWENTISGNRFRQNLKNFKIKPITAFSGQTEMSQLALFCHQL